MSSAENDVGNDHEDNESLSDRNPCENIVWAVVRLEQEEAQEREEEDEEDCSATLNLHDRQQQQGDDERSQQGTEHSDVSAVAYLCSDDEMENQRKRCTLQRIGWILFWVALACFSLFLQLVLVLWVGSMIQQSKVNKISIPKANLTSNVCCLTQNSTEIVFRTFESDIAAREEPNALIAHCGDCGKCSNPQDIATYDDTADTLYDTAVKCAKKTLLQGRNKGADCMLKVGLTPACTGCWMDSIRCNLRKCAFICMWHGMFRSIDSNGGTAENPTSLNRCTTCDHARCRSSFLSCSGATRARLGIRSDIERAPAQMCSLIETPWWKDDQILESWRNQNKT